MTKSDPNRVLRRLPLVVGGLGAILLLVNRLLTPQLTDSQARGDVLGVVLSAILILDRKSTRLNSSHEWISRMPSSA